MTDFAFGHLTELSARTRQLQAMWTESYYNKTWSDDHESLTTLDEFTIEWYDDTNDDWVNPPRSRVYAREEDFEGPSFQEFLEDWISLNRVPCHLCSELFPDEFFLDIHLKRDHKVVWK